MDFGGLNTISFVVCLIQWRLTDTLHVAVCLHFEQNQVRSLRIFLHTREVHVWIPCGWDFRRPECIASFEHLTLHPIVAIRDAIGAAAHRISGLVVEYFAAIDVTRVRFPADALAAPACRLVSTYT